MLPSEPDPLIHDLGRLRAVATLAALPDGDALSVTRLEDVLRLPPGRLSTCLRELDRAGYLRTGTTGRNTAQTTVALTRQGRAALDRYTAMLRQLPWVARQDHQAPAPYVRAGDAGRDAAAPSDSAPHSDTRASRSYGPVTYIFCPAPAPVRTAA